jgi:hypothetical protein
MQTKKRPKPMSRGLGRLSFVQEGLRISWAETAGSMRFGGVYPDFNPSFFAPEQRLFALPKSTVLNKLGSISFPSPEKGTYGDICVPHKNRGVPNRLSEHHWRQCPIVGAISRFHSLTLKQGKRKSSHLCNRLISPTTSTIQRRGKKQSMAQQHGR